ncbi:MAG TPA: DegV family protein [Candidatus Pacearchaeota archaeon]|nr:DegV family protein [Candidatus Pacearchaeota archaeon]
MDYISQNELKKMLLFSSERIERDKEQINKINVFPVPDQDTGNNLSATLEGIKSNIEDKNFESIAELSDSVLDGALTSAQGNTGIIYTGFLAGFFPCIAEEKEVSAEKMGIAFEKGYERARESIQDPKEGTMLDVIKAFALAIKDYSKKEKDIVKNFYFALEKANEALLDTPNKMEVLKKAGVVDAGGLGFLMILETYLDTLKEQEEDPFVIKTKQGTEIMKPKRFIQILSNRYEVVALLDNGYCDEKQIREKLDPLGNCLDIIKIKNRTKIHIHTDMPYEVRDIIKKMGNIENLRIEDMAKEVTGQKSVENVSIGMVIDERAGLSPKIISHYDIEVIPLRIIWEEGENVAGENVCQRIKEAKEKGISSCPKIEPILPEFFMESYKTQLQKFDDVLCIVSSSALSNNYDSALKGRDLLSEEEKNHVHVIDSKNISAGQSILILEAIEMIAEQRKIEEIVRKIDKTIDKVNLYCIVEKNDWWNKEKKSWLKKKTRYSLGEMRNGKIVHIENVKNTEFAEAIFRKIEKNSKKEIENGKRIRAVIAHGDNLEEAEKLKKLLKGIKKTDISFINITDPVTSINACPQSLLVGWIIK